ncbi:MAG: DUF2207 domain-containing protein, partial [Pseudomonadota bacterium]
MKPRLGTKFSLILLLIIALLVPFCAAASEEILDFTSNIDIYADRSMSVRETIVVRAEGKQIRRGIFRDFPTDYQDKFGNRYRVRFDVETVLKDGAVEPFKTERINNGVRVYIGRTDVRLSPGEYRYEIVYRTDRQLGFFDQHDELYWNVTGTGWAFPIKHAAANIKLPVFVDPMEMKTDAYTGPQGSTDKNFSAYVDDLGVAHFETTNTLAAREGLTVVFAWPKGVIAEPRTSERIADTLADNLHVLLALIGIIGLGFYYLLTWDRVGRDPLKGVVVANYEPPPGYSPASMRYIEKMGYDKRCFTSAVINLAVKGYLTIDDTDRHYLLTKTGEDVELAPGESVLAKELFGFENLIELKQSNHRNIGEALEAHEGALSSDYENKYFKTNRKFFFIGLVLSVALIALVAVLANRSVGLSETLFLSVWASVWWFATGAGLIGAWNSIRYAHSFTTWVSAICRVLFLVPFVIAGVFALTLFSANVNWPVIAFLFAIVTLNVVFYQLLKAPTMLGRTLLDKVDGFRHYVEIAEKHELDYRNPAGKTPQLFEKYLPYALALEIEQQWAEQFNDVIANAAGSSNGYSPTWYHGSHWHPSQPSHFSSALAGSLTSAIASSSTAPGSSSGGMGG